MIRRLARPLLGAALISSGLEAWQGIDRRSARAEQLGIPEPVRTTRATAGVQVAGGVLLVLNRMPRIAALVLAVTVIPEAVTGHDFWGEKDPETKRGLRSLFARDLGLLGGLLVTAIESGGRESVPHKASRATRSVAAAATPH